MKPHEIEDPKLQELARRLGAAAAERLDVDGVTRGVVARLREPARRSVSEMCPRTSFTVHFPGAYRKLPSLSLRPANN